MKSRKLYYSILMVLLILGCCMPVAAQNTMALNYSKVTVNIGDSLNLDMLGTDNEPTWFSDNENIVSVNRVGEITAKRTGTTNVKARVGVEYKTCKVTVVNPSIKLNKSVYTIYTGGTSTYSVQLKATVKGANKNVNWSSSNPNVAVVDRKGKVTSMAAGETVISASANGMTANCVITVKETDISLNFDKVSLSTKGVGSSTKLKAIVIGSNKSVKWTTSDKKIATVSNGTVKGKKNGTVTITATANGVSASCEVDVNSMLPSIGEEQITLYIKNGQSESKTLKTNVTLKTDVTWESSNSEVATVDANGNVLAVSEGNAIISAKNGMMTDTCLVTVKESVTDIKETQVTLKTKGENKTYTLTKEIVGRSSTAKWKSSNTKIVSVTNGKLTAKKEGSAYITVTANGISDTVKVIVQNYDPTIKINQTEYVLYTGKGNSVSLKATVDGPDKKVTWESTNPEIATVNGKGKVVAVSPGTVTIKATANGVSTQCSICVKETSVSLEHMTLALSEGKIGKIPVNVVGKSQTVKWTSSNKKVATVKNGVVTAKKSGETIITATANGVSVVCNVYVSACEHVFEEKSAQVSIFCNQHGIREYVCKECGFIYEDYIPLSSHHYQIVSEIEPTCSSGGKITYQCNKCDSSYTENTEKLAHEYETVTLAATCNKQGIIYNTCNACGESVLVTYIDAEGHDYENVTIPPSCFEKGYNGRVCNRCQDMVVDKWIPAYGKHEYITTVIDPTCEEKGCTRLSCSRCDYCYEHGYVDELGHDFSIMLGEEHVEVKKNSKEYHNGEDVSYGYISKKCSRCEETETEYEVRLYCDNKLERNGFEYLTILPGESRQLKMDSFMPKELIPYLYFKDDMFDFELSDKITISDDFVLTVSEDAIFDENQYYGYKLLLKENPYHATLKDSYSRYIVVQILSKDELEANNRIHEVISQIITEDMTDEEKVLAVHNWICMNTTYGDGTRSAGGPLNVMLEGKGVCADYARTFDEFMLELDIPCFNMHSSKMNHLWNCVKLDDGWYWLDCTWDDSSMVDYDYFLKTGKRVDDEVIVDEGGTELTYGTKWQSGTALFQQIAKKYLITEEADVYDVYLVQKNRPFIYFGYDSIDSYNSRVGLEWVEMYEEIYGEPIYSFISSRYFRCYQNTDKLQQLFENKYGENNTFNISQTVGLDIIEPESETGTETEIETETGTETGTETEIETETGTETGTETETEPGTEDEPETESETE